MQKQANTANPNHRWVSAVSGLEGIKEIAVPEVQAILHEDLQDNANDE